MLRKKLRGGSMLERGKEDKMREAGSPKKLRGVCRRGKEKTKCEGGGLMQKKIGDMPERGKDNTGGVGG